MRDRTAIFLLIALILAAAFVVWLWWSDAWLKHQCRSANGNWDAAARTCRINADRTPERTASLRR